MLLTNSKKGYNRIQIKYCLHQNKQFILKLVEFKVVNTKCDRKEQYPMFWLLVSNIQQ